MGRYYHMKDLDPAYEGDGLSEKLRDAFDRTMFVKRLKDSASYLSFQFQRDFAERGLKQFQEFLSTNTGNNFNAKMITAFCGKIEDPALRTVVDMHLGFALEHMEQIRQVGQKARRQASKRSERAPTCP